MKRFFFSLFLLAPLFSFSQSNFRPGYVVTDSGDTLKGYINYKERSLNSSSFTFEPALHTKIQEFNLKNCAAYGVNDAERFERFKVDISMSKEDISDLSLGPDSSLRTDTVFLKVLQAGRNVTLYAYQDAVKMRFYIREKDSNVPVELIYQLYLHTEKSGSIVTNNKFAGQLLDEMQRFDIGTVEDKRKLRRLRYAETELLNVIAMINGQGIAKSNYAKTRFFMGGGLMETKTAYYGQADLANTAAKSKSSYAPMVTAGLDVFANPAIGKLIYRLELSFFTSKGDISTTTSNVSSAQLRHTFDQYTLALSPQVIYNVYNSSSLKAFIGAGLGFNFSSYKNNVSARYNSFRQEWTTTENEVKFENFNLSIPVKGGVVLHKKIELYAGYAMPSNITNYSFFSVRVQRLNVGVNYLFGK